jgi:DNA-binding response OmpR family regulator
VPNETLRPSPLPPLSPQRAVAFAQTAVLIIDDDPVYRSLLRGLCHKIGVGRIAEAADGEQGLACLGAVRPDLILLDIVMPGIDGLEVCRRLRTLPHMADTAVLIQTDQKDEARKLAGFAAGATDYITKPLSVPECTARVQTHLANALNTRRLSAFHARIDGQLSIARDYLTALLPNPAAAQQLAARNGFALEVRQRYHAEIGGDLWYIHELAPGKILIILLDPNTEGIAGAINALRVDTVLRELWRTITDPQKLLQALDRAMAESPCGRLFASVTAVVLDHAAKSLWYTASGNPYPIFCRGQHAATLVSGGLPLGSGLATLELHHLALQSQDCLLLHSDGWPNLAAADNPLDLIHPQLQRTGLVLPDLLSPESAPTDDVTLISIRVLG